MNHETTELREKLDKLVIELDRLDITLDSPVSNMTVDEYEQEREKLLDGFTQAIVATLGSEPPYGELLRCLENDWHIRASWDGLRKFWCIELTEEGVRLRDEAATLGRGTCENIAQRYLDFLCSECGFVHYIDDANCTGDGNEWNYCPKCGEVVEQ